MQALFVIKNTPAQIMPYDAGMKNGTKRSPIGERLAQARLAAGLSQEQLSKKLGISQQMVGYLELQPIAIRPELLVKLSTTLGISIEDLLGMETRPRRFPGPIGKVRSVFEAVSHLPRRQQQKIAEVVNALVAQHGNGHKQAA